MMALKNEKNAAQARERKPARNEALFERIRREYLEKKVREGICGRLLLRAGERAVLSLLAGEVSVSVQGGKLFRSGEPASGGGTDQQADEEDRRDGVLL